MCASSPALITPSGDKESIGPLASKGLLGLPLDQRGLAMEVHHGPHMVPELEFGYPNIKVWMELMCTFHNRLSQDNWEPCKRQGYF